MIGPQKLAEADHACVGVAWSRWNGIRDVLTDQLRNTRLLRPSATRNIADIWISRRNKQTSDIHLVAYFLDPRRITERRRAP